MTCPEGVVLRNSTVASGRDQAEGINQKKRLTGLPKILCDIMTRPLGDPANQGARVGSC